MPQYRNETATRCAARQASVLSQLCVNPDPAFSFVAESRLVLIPSRTPRSQTRETMPVLLSSVALVAALCGLALQQALRPSLSPVSDAISAYDVGSYAYLQTLALGAMGAGSVALALVLSTKSSSTLMRLGSAFVAAWGGGVALLAVINVNDGPLPTSGAVHEVVATLAFGAGVAATVCVSRAYARLQIWTIAAAASWIAAGTTLATLAIVLEDSSWFGLVERSLGVTIVAWLIAATRTPAGRVLHPDHVPQDDVLPLALVPCEAKAA